MGVRRYKCSGFLIITVFLLFTVLTETQISVGNQRIDPAPLCSKPCINGKCTGYNRCSCKAGYAPKLHDKFECFPICKGGCPSLATCTSPAKCECKTGYQLDIRSCEPMCITPTRLYCPKEDGPCWCKPEWRKNITSRQCAACVARCERPCGNGTCISPNACECFAGYEIQWNSVNKVGPLCVPICKNCEGTCVAPNQCVCQSPYEAKNVTANGEDCNCFMNCSDLQKTCEKTICVTSNSSNGQWWIYVLVAFLVVAIGAVTCICYKKHLGNKYNVNGTKSSNPADCVKMSEIPDLRSS